jgi:hypothetical protein
VVRRGGCAGIFIQCAPTQVVSGGTVNCTGGFGDASNGGLFSSDITCCWRVLLSNGTAMNSWQCSAVRQNPYPFVSTYLYSPTTGASRNESVRLQCCTDRTIAPAMCAGTTVGTSTLPINTNIAASPTGRRRALAAARLLQGLQ